MALAKKDLLATNGERAATPRVRREKARGEDGKFREGPKHAWELLAQALARVPLVKEG